MEAMSAGAAVIASDTAPVREVMRDGETAVLVNFFDANALLTQLIRVLTDLPLRARLGVISAHGLFPATIALGGCAGQLAAQTLR